MHFFYLTEHIVICMRLCTFISEPYKMHTDLYYYYPFLIKSKDKYNGAFLLKNNSYCG